MHLEKRVNCLKCKFVSSCMGICFKLISSIKYFFKFLNLIVPFLLA